MDYLNQKKNIPFEIQAFTNVSSFVAYAKENPVELLLISAEAMCREVGELDIGKIVILTEGSKPEELDKYADVYKYQASSDIVREVMACYGAEKAVLPAQMPALKKTTELFGIYSPLGFCGQTSFALALAQILGRSISYHPDPEARKKVFSTCDDVFDCALSTYSHLYPYFLQRQLLRQLHFH